MDVTGRWIDGKDIHGRVNKIKVSVGRGPCADDESIQSNENFAPMTEFQFGTFVLGGCVFLCCVY